MDGSSFPDDFRRLMYQQDEPVIGSAMFPMSIVSRLASESVKVCLGGQAADEVFGGYARYALGQPTHVLRSWFSDRAGSGQPSASEAKVGSNLSRQVAEGGTLYRLARNARHLVHWETSYFEHFAKVPERSWLDVFSGPEFASRNRCRQLFHEVVSRSPASKPMDKIMHWDLQTYLTGLFHQDDRMSMASSLESRVPFADPRIVQFAFRIDPDLRFRGGSSKWLLRKAVSNVLPSLVLSRRKVGFDTPAAAWIAEHPGFVRDTLLSRSSIERGFWDRRGIETLLSTRDFDVLWKVLSIEVWASLFLDSTAQPHRSVAVSRASAPDEPPMPASLRLRYFGRECLELGIRGTAARASWELKTRGGLTRIPVTAFARDLSGVGFLKTGDAHLPFTDPREVHGAAPRFLAPENADRLTFLATESTRGRLLCFGKWMGDFGNPIDWHRDPINEHRWRSDEHWANALHGSGRTDVKFTWEAGRFPQAYFLARAAAVNPAAAPAFAEAFCAQVLDFIEHNPPAIGVHWFSGQEIAFRMFAWLFGLHVFDRLGFITTEFKEAVGRHFAACAAHIARHIEYARDSVYNNHLLSEALGLFVAGSLLHGVEAEEWKATGFALLLEEADRQIYPDGGYIQQSHTYHRVAMELYLWATAFLIANGQETPRVWLAAMDRSLDFMLAHQNARDGRLPNYGSNDGSDPIVLCLTDFADFRAILQAISVITRKKRIYPPGPWDETAVWLFGPGVLDLPLNSIHQASCSFAFTGYHVLRGPDPCTFAAFRCGSVRDRFSQIDMLHVDVWWRGQNVLTDPGSYLYNGAPEWHNHFLRTASHNTVQVDGRDQMPHIRQFKTLYPTPAKLLRFHDTSDFVVAIGEHYGYTRIEHCTHRRSVLFLKKEETWIVVDTIEGTASHKARLHWLAGPYPHEFDQRDARLTLDTPQGQFHIAVFDGNGQAARDADVVQGSENPPRGWLSRYYGHKIPAPSLAVSLSGPLPLTFLTVASPAVPKVEVQAGSWAVSLAGTIAAFRVEQGEFADVEIQAMPVPEVRA